MSQYLLIFPLIIALFFGLFFLIRKKHSVSYKILSLYFFLFALTLCTSITVSLSIKHSIDNHFINFSSLLFYVFLLAIPPTFYLYVTTLSDVSKIKSQLTYYYIPITLLIINTFSFIYLSNNENTESFIFTSSEMVMNYANFIALLFIFPVLNIYYIYKAIKFYMTHKREIKNVFSYELGINLKWMLHYILGYIIFILCIYSIQFDAFSTLLKVPMSLFMVIYLSYIGYRGLNQIQIVFVDQNNDSEFTSINTEGDTSANKKLVTDIVSIMEQESLYLNSNLTIHELSQKLNSNSKSISYILNNEFKQNFVSFINTYRINAAKEILSNSKYQNYTIEAIGEEVGFNSKSAFNRAFKKYTDTTPSQYRNNQ